MQRALGPVDLLQERESFVLGQPSLCASCILRVGLLPSGLRLLALLPPFLLAGQALPDRMRDRHPDLRGPLL